MGVMAGTVDLMRRGLVGVEPGGDFVSVDARLPPQLTTVRYATLVRGCWLDVALANGRLTMSNRSGNKAGVKIKLRDQEALLGPGQSVEAIP